jgi:hypothetical protein
MTTRRPPRGRTTAQHLAEIHRQLQRNDRRMARLARSLEQLFDVLREQHGARPSSQRDLRPFESVESPPDL